MSGARLHIGIRFHAADDPASEEWTVRSVDERGGVVCESATGRRTFSRGAVEDGISRTAEATSAFDDTRA
ncbi:hypothetical protein [Rathayibacter sp. VKM Ac-2630]|uniref:hypothetical protein n=1 Tax=Rathayibacter sp. VKM Ac-2630 TaxID=1938617 RepID=UPI000980A8AE|nr:hypothetical protein [Rathayibacter sp. VKM Ac-2630]OOB90095.1 hypothetical protein B0T42_13740 [Rathayibacter sp. VKM Ac-2630]